MLFLWVSTDGVPCSQNPTEAIEAWINFNKEERESFAESLKSSLKVRQISLDRDSILAMYYIRQLDWPF